MFCLGANRNCLDMRISPSWHYDGETMTAAQNFTSDPTDARRMFLAACLEARLPVSSFESQSSSEKGCVHVDIATAGNSDAPTVIVLCPGARLTDGLCASADAHKPSVNLAPGQRTITVGASLLPAVAISTWTQPFSLLDCDSNEDTGRRASRHAARNILRASVGSDVKFCAAVIVSPS